MQVFCHVSCVEVLNGSLPLTVHIRRTTDVTTWLFYRESCKAEDYTVLAGRLASILPDMRRIFEEGAKL